MIQYYCQLIHLCFFSSRIMVSTSFVLLLVLGMSVQLSAQTKVVGYVTNDLVYQVNYNAITHLNIAFENPDAAGNLTYATANDAYIDQAHKHGVKVLVSLAGGGASHNPAVQNLYFSLIKDENRASFVEKILTYINDHNLDGLDVDLEGPAINADYGKFISDLSAALKPQGKLLTSALSHMNGAAKVPDATVNLFDFINIMAYDVTGPWRPNDPDQHSSFEFAIESLVYWTSRGLPKQKAVLGVPFYGYGFGTDFNEGIGFGDIVKRFPGSENKDVVGNTIYYNGIPTIRQKAQYVVDGNYGGIMIWQLAHDATGSLSLLKTINEVIHITATGQDTNEVVELYPNPVDSLINLNSLGFKNMRVSVTDLAGNECLVVAKANDFLDVSMLPAGLYILRLSNESESLIKKFTKQ
jgi:chitinase